MSWLQRRIDRAVKAQLARTVTDVRWSGKVTDGGTFTGRVTVGPKRPDFHDVARALARLDLAIRRADPRPISLDDLAETAWGRGVRESLAALNVPERLGEVPQRVVMERGDVREGVEHRDHDADGQVPTDLGLHSKEALQAFACLVRLTELVERVLEVVVVHRRNVDGDDEGGVGVTA